MASTNPRPGPGSPSVPGAGTGTDGAAVAGNETGWKGDGVWLQGREDQAGPGCAAPAPLHGSFPLCRSHGTRGCCSLLWDSLATSNPRPRGFEGWELCVSQHPCVSGWGLFSAFVSSPGFHSGPQSPCLAGAARPVPPGTAPQELLPCTAAHCASLAGIAAPTPQSGGTALCTPAWLWSMQGPLPSQPCAPQPPVPTSTAQHPIAQCPRRCTPKSWCCTPKSCSCTSTTSVPAPRLPCGKCPSPAPSHTLPVRTETLRQRLPSGTQKLLPGEAGLRRAWPGFAWA